MSTSADCNWRSAGWRRKMPSRGLLVGFVILQEDAADRNSVLGLNSQVSASRLARLLLADPLGNEEGWEKELEKADEANERAVLLK